MTRFKTAILAMTVGFLAVASIGWYDALLSNSTGTSPSTVAWTNGAGMQGIPTNAITPMVNLDALKAPIASPTFTGTVTGPTITNNSGGTGLGGAATTNTGNFFMTSVNSTMRVGNNASTTTPSQIHALNYKNSGVAWPTFVFPGPGNQYVAIGPGDVGSANTLRIGAISSLNAQWPALNTYQLTVTNEGNLVVTSNLTTTAGSTNIFNGIVLGQGFTTTISNGLAGVTITFPATAATWTNTLGYNIVLYVDTTAVTGSVLKQNGTQISSSLVAGDLITLCLKTNDFFSLAYTIGTPSGVAFPR